MAEQLEHGDSESRRNGSGADGNISSSTDPFFELYGLRILQSLRRIIHAVDSHSRRLNTEYRVTGPQLTCLYSIVKNGPMTLSELARQVHLGGSTINGIVDRLEAKGLARRERSHDDRRKVLIYGTPRGEEATLNAPLLLQGRLSRVLRQLPELEQVTIALSLEKIVDLMEDQQIKNYEDFDPEIFASYDRKDSP